MKTRSYEWQEDRARIEQRAEAVARQVRLYGSAVAVFALTQRLAMFHAQIQKTRVDRLLEDHAQRFVGVYDEKATLEEIAEDLRAVECESRSR